MRKAQVIILTVYRSFLELRNCGGNVSKQLAKVATQRNSGATGNRTRVPPARIPSALTTKRLRHTYCPTYTWASIIGWTGGHVPLLFEVCGT